MPREGEAAVQGLLSPVWCQQHATISLNNIRNDVTYLHSMCLGIQVLHVVLQPSMCLGIQVLHVVLQPVVVVLIIKVVGSNWPQATLGSAVGLC